MPLKRDPGFALVEVVIAVMVLAWAVTAAAAALLVAGGSLGGAQRERSEAAAVDAEVECLRSLQFLAPPAATPPPSGATPPIAGCLIADVFPHTAAVLDRADAFFERSPASSRQGAFVTLRETAGIKLRIVARFVISSCDGWRDVPFADVDGFDSGSASPPPSDALLIDIEVVREGDAGAAQATRLLVTSQKTAAGMP